MKVKITKSGNNVYVDYPENRVFKHPADIAISTVGKDSFGETLLPKSEIPIGEFDTTYVERHKSVMINDKDVVAQHDYIIIDLPGNRRITANVLSDFYRESDRHKGEIS